MGHANTSESPSKSSPLTVLFAPAHTFVDQSEGGSEYHWPYKLIEHLALDYDVRIIALLLKARVERDLPGVELVSVDPGGSLPTTNLERLRFHLRVYAKARQILASRKEIDIVHHMLPFGLRAAFNFLAFQPHYTHPPMVIGPLQPPNSFTGNDEFHVSVRNFAAMRNSSPTTPLSKPRNPLPPLSALATTPVLSTLSGITLRRADALVAISDQAAQMFGSSIGRDRKNFTIIPAGVDTQEFRPATQRRQHEDEDQVEILAVGYLMQRKAFDVLIRAVANLIKMGFHVRLRIIGDGPAFAGLEALARELDIAGQVIFTGHVPHDAMAEEYPKADIFCSMSLSESFGAVGLEAMACGLPVVATPTGLFRTLLKQHKVGALVDFGNVPQLTSALAQLVKDHALRETLGQRARQVTVEEYDWSLIAGRYLDIYRALTPHGKG